MSLGPHALTMPVMLWGDELVDVRQEIWARYLNADPVSEMQAVSAPSPLNSTHQLSCGVFNAADNKVLTK